MCTSMRAVVIISGNKHVQKAVGEGMPYACKPYLSMLRLRVGARLALLLLLLL